jgi:hypothetical protein
VIAGGLLSAVRLLPPRLEVSAFRAHGLVTDVIGYPSVMHLLESLVALRRESPAFDEALPGNIWFFDRSYYEFNAYVGVVGVAFLVIGLYRSWRAALPIYRQMIVPVLAMTAFSIASVYRIVRLTQVPLVESERYTARMFSLPLVLLIVIAAAEIDGYMQRATTSVWHRVLALAALAALAIDITANLRLWRVLISSGLFGHGRAGSDDGRHRRARRSGLYRDHPRRAGADDDHGPHAGRAGASREGSWYHRPFVTVPLLDLNAQYVPLRQALLDAVTRVCDSQRFIGGPEVEGSSASSATRSGIRMPSACRRAPTPSSPP